MCKALQFLRVKKYAKAIEALKAFEKKDPALPTPPRTLPHPGDGRGGGECDATHGGRGALPPPPHVPRINTGRLFGAFFVLRAQSEVGWNLAHIPQA